MSTAFPICPDEPRMLAGRLDDDGTDTARLSLAGELDLAVAPALEGLLRALTRDRELTVVVDMGAITFCDLAGLRALRAARDAAGGRVAVAGVPPLVERLLALLEVPDPFSVAPRAPARPRATS